MLVLGGRGVSLVASCTFNLSQYVGNNPPEREEVVSLRTMCPLVPNTAQLILTLEPPPPRVGPVQDPVLTP